MLCRDPVAAKPDAELSLWDKFKWWRGEEKLLVTMRTAELGGYVLRVALWGLRYGV